MFESLGERFRAAVWSLLSAKVPLSCAALASAHEPMLRIIVKHFNFICVSICFDVMLHESSALLLRVSQDSLAVCMGVGGGALPALLAHSYPGSFVQARHVRKHRLIRGVC